MGAVRKLETSRAAQIADDAAEHFNDPSRAGKLWVPSAANAISRDNNVAFKYDSIDEAFPNVDPGEHPAGNLVLVQVRQPKSQSTAGIILDTETRKAELDNTQVARVVRMGPLAFKNRTTGEQWPEGAWAQVGSFVRIPKYQGNGLVCTYTRDDIEVDEKTGDRRKVKVKDEVHFFFLKDLSIISLIDDPLTVRAYL